MRRKRDRYNKKMKKIIYTVLFLAAVTLTSCSKPTPSSVAEEYMEALQDGDYEKAVDMMHFHIAKTDAEKKQFVALMHDKADKSINRKQGITNVEVVSEEIKPSGQNAYVVCKVKFGNGEESEEKLHLRRYGDDWVVDAGK